MAIDYDILIQALIDIFKHQPVQCAVKETAKGGLLAGCTTILGGLLLGPVGLAVGGALGGGAAALMSTGKFQSVPVILKNMTYNEKKAIYEKFMKAFEKFGAEDIMTLSMLVLSNKSLTDLAVKEALKFIQNDMKMVVK